MSDKFSSINVDDISKAIEHIVRSDTIAQGDKERTLDTMADALARLTSAAQLGKASVRAAQNAHASGAARLSPEAIGIIILCLKKLHERLVASHVCRLWRSVAHDMPDPWPLIRLYSLGNVERGTGWNKHAQPESDHCYYDVGMFARIESNLSQLNGILALPWKAPVKFDFELTSHCDAPFEYSTKDAVQTRINAAFDAGKPLPRARLAAALDLEISSGFLDLLHPLSAAADRIASLTLTTLCSNWLNLLPYLPPMTALRTLIIAAHEECEEPPALPDILYSILGEASAPQLRVAFPVLETLKVDGIAFRDSSYSDLSITAGRVAGLLASVPLLRCLELRLSGWPEIIQDDSDDAAFDSDEAPEDADEAPDKRDKGSRRVKVDLKNLKKVILRSTEGDEENISRFKVMLPVNPGSSIDVDTVEDVPSDSP